MLNSIGLENPGVEVFLREKLPLLAQWGVPVIVSIASEGDQKEFVRLAEALEARKEVAAIEVNISCPNVTHGKMRLAHRLVAQDPRATRAVVKAVRKVTEKTIITKLSPNVTDIVEIAQAAEDAGSDAIALINTLMGLSIDIENRKAKVAMGIAGLSGPAVRPVAVRMVHSVYQRVRIPLIGMGGIVDAASALEFIIAGATAVSVGTANFINPGVGQEIIGGLKEYLHKHKIKDVKHLIGSFVL
jgi:dihydroorotate dehydrogenase (NAD+) catalytic subunit